MHQFEVYLPNGEERKLTSTNATEFVDELCERDSGYWTDAVVVQSTDELGGWIHIFRVEGLGWQVVCHGKSDSFEHYLGDESQPDEEVTVRKAGILETYKQRAFVEESQMRNAAVTYIESLEREANESWTPIGS